MIRLIGSVWPRNGYSKHTLGLLHGLKKLGEDVCLEAQLPPDWPLYKELYDPMVLKALARAGETEGRSYDDDAVWVTRPEFAEFGLPDCRNNHVFFVEEGSIAPLHHRVLANDPRIKTVLCPSKHSLEALQGSGKGKSFVVPEGYDPNIFRPGRVGERVRKVFPEFDGLTFLWNKGWTGHRWDRSGLPETLLAYSMAFQKEDNVRLMIKINPAYGTPKDVVGTLQNMGINPPQAPCHILNNNVSDEEMADHYNASDVFITSSYAEAFNLPVVEAMACGKPVIYHDYGGHTDFAIGIPVPSASTIEAGGGGGQLYEGVNWSIPDVPKLAQAMRFYYEHQDLMRAHGVAALEQAKNFSWEQSCKKLLEAIRR